MEATVDTLCAFSNGAVELLCVFLKPQNLVIGVIYRQPNDAKGKHFSKANEFKAAVDELTLCPNRPLRYC